MQINNEHNMNNTNGVLNSDVKPVEKKGVVFNDIETNDIETKDRAIKRRLLNRVEQDRLFQLQNMNRHARRAIGKQFKVKIRGIDNVKR